ncbi:uncharacterized protein G2W53_017466 [Senna tora]|uniref:Uncharacterized protein n=1 Tax=Senna tora TaxID=362788 RepID=A0A834TRY9_9FABA|nr:uncharacterized protein G2W53_017466 [Senna tora]
MRPRLGVEAQQSAAENVNKFRVYDPWSRPGVSTQHTEIEKCRRKKCYGHNLNTYVS